MHNFFIYSSTTDNVEQRTELKRTGVHIMPRASLCTATYEAVSNRGGVEPLLLQEYVHGNCGGCMIKYFDLF